MKRFVILLFLSLIVLFSAVVNSADFYGLVCESLLNFSCSIATYSNLAFTDFDTIGDLKIYNLGSDYKGVDESDDFISKIVSCDYSSFINSNYFETVPCVLTEKFDGIVFKYLYDYRLPKILTLDGVGFNLQVAISNGVVKIGYPCIVDSI